MEITLKAWNTQKIIMSGDFVSHRRALEHAIDRNIKLDYLELSDVDLSHGNFDSGSFNYARFTRVNLEGSNLSEASFIKSVFEECNLTNVTLTDTVCVGTQFKKTKMINCEALHADFRGCLISCAHFLKSDFRQSAHFGGAAFMSRGNICSMSKGPIFIRGLGLDVILLDDHAIIGGTMIIRKEQLFDQHGKISSIFANAGCAPSKEALQKLWLCVRPDIQSQARIA